jgi:hypothetical protein
MPRKSKTGWLVLLKRNNLTFAFAGSARAYPVSWEVKDIGFRQLFLDDLSEF